MPHLLRKIGFNLCCFLLLTQPTIAQGSPLGTEYAGKYYTSFDKLKIYHEVQGQGQPVILVHGFRNTLENWKRKSLYQDLIKSGFQVVALDLRGKGKSDKP